MSSSWLLDIFGDSDLRSSTKLRHIGNVKSVIFIKKKQTNPSLCSIVNLPILHSPGLREHWQHCFFLYSLCCCVSPAEGTELSPPPACPAVHFPLQAAVLPPGPFAAGSRGAEQPWPVKDHLCCRKVGNSSLSWSCCINQKCPHSEAGSVPHFTQFQANWCKLHFESMLIHRNSTNWEGLTEGRGF